MHSFARLPVDDRKLAIRNAASKEGLHEAIVEKDFWVCFMLDYLFHKSPWQKRLGFKGGTSLSKAYNAIARFSEDIDLILDWRLLGYGIDEPWKERSRTRQAKFNEEANRRTVELLKREFLPRLNADMEDLTGYGDSVSMLEDDDNPDCEQTIVFSYPASFRHGTFASSIRLEIGALAAWTPMNPRNIGPIVAAHYPNVFSRASTTIRTTAIERAFWEKATILHREANRPGRSTMPKRYARHYYDLYCLYGSPYRQAILDSTDLLKIVADFKDRFYYSSWADYETARPGTLKLLPPAHSMDAFRKDYASMRPMIYGEYPEFEKLIEGIGNIQTEINSAI